MTIVMSPAFLKASQEPSASAGFSSTPATVTFRSPRGRLTLYTSPGCSAPALPNACSTGFQSAAVCGEPGVALLRSVWGAEHAASTKTTATAVVVIDTVIRLQTFDESRLSNTSDDFMVIMS